MRTFAFKLTLAVLLLLLSTAPPSLSQTSLDDLSDVQLSSPQLYDLLIFNGIKWINSNLQYVLSQGNESYGSNELLYWDSNGYVLSIKNEEFIQVTGGVNADYFDQTYGPVVILKLDLWDDVASIKFSGLELIDVSDPLNPNRQQLRIKLPVDASGNVIKALRRTANGLEVVTADQSLEIVAGGIKAALADASIVTDTNGLRVNPGDASLITDTNGLRVQISDDSLETVTDGVRAKLKPNGGIVVEAGQGLAIGATVGGQNVTVDDIMFKEIAVLNDLADVVIQQPPLKNNSLSMTIEHSSGKIRIPSLRTTAMRLRLIFLTRLKRDLGLSNRFIQTLITMIKG